MPRAAALALALAVLGGAAAGCSGAGAETAPTPATVGELTVRRGDLRQRLLLTGELRAVRARELVVPQSPSWRVQIRRLADDGAEVVAGEPVVEFDTTEFASDLEEKRLALREKENEVDRSRARGEVTEAEKGYALLAAEAALEKAASRADVPPGLLSARELQDRRLARERAEVEVAKAREDLEAAGRANRAEQEIARIDVERARREIEVAERALRDLTLLAPEDGVFVVEENRWEGGRKLQEGDMVFVGMTVARLPDLSSMRVRAVLSDVDDGRVTPGMAATCTLDAYPDTSRPCRVASVAPVARETDHASLLSFFEVGVELAGSDPERMRPGMSVKVDVETATVAGALLAPRRALDLAGPAPRARLAGGGWREVTLGPCGPLECAVEAGLEEGQRLADAAAGPEAGGEG